MATRMKVSAVLFSLLAGCFLGAPSASGKEVRIVLLHHSTGGNLYSEGKIKEWFDDYNRTNNASLRFQAKGYPGLQPGPMYNYPYDYWNLWVNKACDSSIEGRECLDKLARDYEIVIFKHCYPGSDVLPDTGFPKVDSDRKSLENYKLQYRALRAAMGAHPNTAFVVWTLPPRNRVATTPEHARRARQFVEWVKNEFLQEDGKPHPNIFVYDFWGEVAEQEPNPPSGQVNTLKYEYERQHGARDSHPTESANRRAAPVLAQLVTRIAETFPFRVSEKP
jgi:hypothetical protein